MSRASAILLLAAVAAFAQSDPIARLGHDIETGKTKVRFDEKTGYLPWLLDALDIPIESQMLVFSKTGIQGIRTEPANPRRIYFNDSAIVATVSGGTIELIAQDPNKGLIFYLLDQAPLRYQQFLANKKSPFGLRTDCVHCHATKSSGVAETLIRSVVTDDYGIPLEKYGSRFTDNRTPYDQLWGGWFVTGKSTGTHMGNTVRDAFGKSSSIQPTGKSDVAALLVFEHQTRIMNLIARAKLQGEGVNELADAMLFRDEAKLPAPVEGSSGFDKKFAARGPLRELDLHTRLMKYPCSYMIYSDAFQALPASIKAVVYKRIAENPELKGFNLTAQSTASR